MHLPFLYQNRILNLPFYIFCLFIFTLPFSINFSNILFISFVAAAIFRKNFFTDLLAIYNQPIFLLFSGFYLLHIIGLAYSSNLETGLFVLEKELAILVFPLVMFPLFRLIGKKEISFALNAYVLGLIVTVLWLINRFYFLSSTSPDITLEYFFRELAYEYVQLHPSYLCMYLSLGVIIAINQFQNDKSKAFKTVYGIIALLFIAILPLTGARLPLLAFLIIFPGFLIFSIKSRRSRILLIIIIVVSLPVLITKMMEVPTLKRRIEEIKLTELSPPLGIHFNSVNLRVAQILCSKTLLLENWTLGLGTGDVQDGLNNCYKENGWSEVLYDRSYNAHNQYIQTFLTIGLPGFVLLISILVCLGNIAFQGEKKVFIAFLVLFSLCCLTESMLEKNKGIMFFTSFATLFSLPYLRKKLTKEINTKTPKLKKKRAGI